MPSQRSTIQTTFRRPRCSRPSSRRSSRSTSRTQQKTTTVAQTIAFQFIATIGILDRYIVVGKAGSDCFVFFYGSENENEMILLTAMDGFFEALKLMLKCGRTDPLMRRDKVERNEMLKKMPSLFLLMDELCDTGLLSHLLLTRSVLKEIDAGVLLRNVEMRLK